MIRTIGLALAAAGALLLWPTQADAQRGGRGGGARMGGGGARMGGGGGYGGGGYGGGARPSFNRTPSFSPPSRPNYGGGGGYGGGARPSLPANRPSTLPQRPNIGGGATRPPGSIGGARPPINSPGGLPGSIGGARPPISGARPPIAGARPPIGGAGVGRPPVGGWGGANRPPVWSSRPGWNRHQTWVNGYWHGQNSNWWGWNNTGAFFTGMAVGGVGAWGLNSAFYNWGYRPYVNPYVAVAQQPVVVEQPVQVAEAAAPLDYSQPLQTASEPPAPEVADPAIQGFDNARAAFKTGDYDTALQLTDETLKTLTDDAAIHEFRALCLFALKRYDEAAGVLYAVLSAGPGWDWTTLIGLYPGAEVYTAQLRALEEYRRANPNSAAARFVLGYHYLTQGHMESALAEFQGVLKLQPADALSAQLVALLSKGGKEPTPEELAAAAPPADAPKGNIVGSWKAAPQPGVAIELTIGEDGGFRWNVNHQGQSQPIEGKYTYDNGVLSLVRAEDDAMVGRVTWRTDSEFAFQAMGGGPTDPGLTFTK